MNLSGRQQWRSSDLAAYSKQCQCKPGSVLQPAVLKAVSSRILSRSECGNFTPSLVDL